MGKQVKSVIGLLISGILVAGCSMSSANAAAPVSPAPASPQVNRIDFIILQNKVSALESGEASVSTENDAFAVANTKFGPFTVSAEGATPYLDGFKVKLQIGNLTSATFNGAKLKVTWGVADGASVWAYVASRLALKKKEIDVLTTFPPGAFTEVEIVLTPATADEIKTFTVGIELKDLSLRVPRSAPAIPNIR